MKKILAMGLLLVLALSLFGCGKTAETPETEVPTTAAAIGEFGILEDLVDSYGFPFEFRYTEGLELTSFSIFEDSAKREWHTSDDSTTHDPLAWNLTGNTLELSGSWEESFTLDMERGTATSLTNGAQYRIVVHLPGSIDTQWYVSWPTDEGFTEIDGVRQ